MKINVVARWVSRKFTGVFEVSRRYAQSMAVRGGDEIQVFGLEDEFTTLYFPLWQPLPVRIYAARGGAFGYAPALADGLIASRSEVVHVHGIWTYAGVAARQCAQRIGTPYMLSPHGMLDPWAVANSGWKKRLARWLYEERVQARAACLHAATEIEYADLRCFGRKNPVCVIPYGVDIPDFTQQGTAPWGDAVPAGAKILLFMGRFHPKKGLLPLLQGWKLWKDNDRARRDDWHLVMMGYDEGGHEQELRNFVGAHELARTVHFIPPQFGERRAGAFFHSHAFILPSFSEGLPTAVLLAWAHGKPVLISQHCNLNFGLQKGAGLPVNPEAGDVARTLRQMAELSDFQLRQMGQTGLELVREHFVWSKVAEEMREVYSWMAGGGCPPACVRKI